MGHKTMSIGGATYDLFVRIDHAMVHPNEKSGAFTLPLGAKLRVREVIETCGGGGANTSVGLSRLGCTAYFEGLVATDQWGDKLLKNFEKNHVKTDAMTQVDNEVSSFSIILSASSGERVILNDPGVNEHMHDAVFDRELASSMDWICLNKIPEGACVIQDDLVHIFERPNAPKLTWNPGGCLIEMGLKTKLSRELTAHAELLIMNKEEVLAFTEQSTVEDAIRTLLAAGAKNVCVTDGSNGATASDGKNLYHCPVVQEATVLDTTGAGDAFTTGATWALMEGKNLQTALRAGSINSASVVGALGAQAGLLTDIEMREKLEAIPFDIQSSAL